ncbi:MAG: arylsulfatase [Chloroflexota bacterium]
MSDKPNIIFIMADDMGYGDVGCFNPESKIPTPNMDRLAAEGMRFNDAHSPSAVCTPTRYGVLTGRYCWRSPLKHGVLYGYEPPLIEEERLTVAKLLQDNGYHTACIGKWHLGLHFATKPGQYIDFNRALPWGNTTPEEEAKIDFTAQIGGGPTVLGFDYFFGSAGCPTCQPPYGFIENEYFVEPPSYYESEFPYTGRPGMTAPSWDHSEADPTYARKAVEYIEARAKSDEPFFLYLNPDAPHEPCVESVVPAFARGKSAAGPRGDLVWLVDWMVGEVMDALERTGQVENTLIMVTSDNGALPGDRVQGKQGMAAYTTYDHKSCGDWRGYKSHIWEGGHREPLIARWPGHITPNTESNLLVSLVDLMATCAAIVDVGLPRTAAPDSANLLPILVENATTEVREDLIHHSVTGVFSLRRGAWKCIFESQDSGGWPPPTGGPPVPGTAGQLYNLESDPYEQSNVWDEYPEVVRALSDLLVKYQQTGRSVEAL